MQTKKKKIVAYTTVFGILSVVMVLGTVFDLQISSAVSELSAGEYYSDNVLLNFFETFGETVLYGFISFAGTTFYLSAKNLFKNKTAVVSVIVLSVAVTVGINAFGASRVIKYLAEHYSFENRLDGVLPVILYALSGVTFLGVWYLIVSKINKDTLKSLAIWSLIVIFTAIISQIIVQGLKPVFSRVRFRSMNYAGNFEYYTQWFKCGKLSAESKEYFNALVGTDAYKSFPSGHTASAAITFTLMSLPGFVSGLDRRLWRVFFAVLSFGYTSVIALSRIIIGAHFLTDVTFATSVSFLSYVLSGLIVRKAFLRHSPDIKSENVEIEREITLE